MTRAYPRCPNGCFRSRLRRRFATRRTKRPSADNRSVSIDSAAKDTLQVPSLIAVGYRAPFMHNGCAATLLDRFNPKCGGDKHGNVATLTDAQRNDLVAYLESL